VWLRLPYTQDSIQIFINAIFFSGAFMSFMAVAYIPAYVEDLQMFRKERANGLYGPLPFMLANFLMGIPYLFLITIIFSVIAYWLANFRPTAGGFWFWVLYLFLDLVAAEGLVVLVTSLMPIFVVALAVTAFANGLWMCVGGFLVPPGTLNPFWKCKTCPLSLLVRLC
jgi:ABC-type multidrug transport system permease subunit